jgi:hypothetical protein
MRRLLMLSLLVSLFSTSGLASVRADEAQDIADATARAKQIFQLADQEKYNAMYDLIHPDAHAVVPRVVAVNAFKELYDLAEAGRAQVTDVTMRPWTWPVTGKTYDTSAFVTYDLPYTENGEDKTATGIMNLVKADDGEWRWFFGRDKEYVDTAIQIFGEGVTTRTGAKPLTEGDVVDNTINDLDTFYRDAFEHTDLRYESPGVVLVAEGDSEMTACGPAESGFWAFYCPGDATLYLDDAFLQQLGTEYPFAESFVIAHEWAHHIQTAIGLERVQNPPEEWNQVFSIELELMADCMSGAWAQDVETRGMLTENDIQQTIDFTLQYLGDPPGVDPYNVQAHGSAEQRADAIQGGYNEGFLACNITV